MVRIALRRTLRLLAGSPHDCSEAIMLARGFTDELLIDPVRDKLATAATGIMPASGRTR
jgi:hypothetical protein